MNLQDNGTILSDYLLNDVCATFDCDNPVIRVLVVITAPFFYILRMTIEVIQRAMKRAMLGISLRRRTNLINVVKKTERGSGRATYAQVDSQRRVQKSGQATELSRTNDIIIMDEKGTRPHGTYTQYWVENGLKVIYILFKSI